MLRRFANQAVLLEGDGEDLGRLKHLIEACGVPVDASPAPGRRSAAARACRWAPMEWPTPWVGTPGGAAHAVAGSARSPARADVKADVTADAAAEWSNVTP